VAAELDLTPDAAPASVPDEPAGARWRPWEWPALGSILAVALVLRFHDFTAAPLLTDNMDELDWGWSGLTLLTRHVPYGWSLLPGYRPDGFFTAINYNYPIVHPYLDHPPLFSLLIGGAAWLAGARQMFDVTAEMIRPPVILLSALAIALAYLLGRRLLGRGPALLGAALLATAPGAVLFSRQVESEWLTAVLLLGVLLCVARLLDGDGGWGTLAVMTGCCLLAPLTKVPGLAVAGVATLALAADRRWLPAALALAAAGVGLGLYIAYGALLDWSQFLQVLADQAARRGGVLGAWQFIAAPAGLNRLLHDGWWLLGWLGAAGLLLAGERRAALLLAWPAAGYALAILVLADDRVVGQFGWYRIAVYPEIYLAAGWLVWEAVRRPSLGLLAVVLGVGGATATEWWLGGPDAPWLPNPVLLSAALLAVLGPAALLAWRHRDLVTQRASTVLSGAALAVVGVGNLMESLSLDRIFTHM
jgi:hypothetical protein